MILQLSLRRMSPVVCALWKTDFSASCKRYACKIGIQVTLSLDEKGPSAIS
jgi:hypothetical protein